MSTSQVRRNRRGGAQLTASCCGRHTRTSSPRVLAIPVGQRQERESTRGGTQAAAAASAAEAAFVIGPQTIMAHAMDAGIQREIRALAGNTVREIICFPSRLANCSSFFRAWADL